MTTRRWFLLSLMLASVAAVSLTGVLLRKDQAGIPQQPDIDSFLARHWHHAIAPQGLPPADFSALEASLDPRACGSCHAAQYADWQQSLHSHTMGPGILWQFRLMQPAEANQCMNCHAPLAEQKALIALEHQWPNAPSSPVPDYVPPALGHGGLVCAACHVRSHERFGPEPLQETTGTPLPHGGFTATPAFSDSRFCATCHQFPETGPRTAGKLREDTLNQWQASHWPAAGQHCQSCHMPDRKHQWQGVHSPDMVRQALSASLSLRETALQLTLTNSGAGHHFPTYMVPKVEVELWLISHEGGEENLLLQDTIGWQVDISLEHESFDSRIPAGESRHWHGTLPVSFTREDQLEIRLRVKPREHYERTFLSVLAQADRLDEQTLHLLQAAYQETLDTHFELSLMKATVESVTEQTP